LAELLREAASDPKITDNRKQALRREALSHYDAMILLSPKDYDARVNRASLLCETNDLSGAQVCFEDLLREFKTQERPSTELRSAAAASHVGLGVIYRKRGRFEQAQKEYERALELSPNSALTHLNLGLLYDFHLKKPEEARTHYQRYLDAGGDYEALPEDSPARPPPPKSADAKHSAAEKR
jgi:tetratricopeptide (TPR) repeat protein